MPTSPITSLPSPRFYECQLCGADRALRRLIEAQILADASIKPLGPCILCKDCITSNLRLHRDTPDPYYSSTDRKHLYFRTQPHDTIPGAMSICQDCPSRRKYTCTHPDIGPASKVRGPGPAGTTSRFGLLTITRSPDALVPTHCTGRPQPRTTNQEPGTTSQ